MLTRATLQRIDNRPRTVNRLPLLAAGGGSLVLAALLFVLKVLPTLAILSILLGGALLVLVLYRSQKAKTTISLSYKGNLSDDASARFSEVREALEELVSSQKVWRLPEAAKLPRSREVGPTPERETARVGLLETPGIKADVPVWGIEATDEESIFFFPEGILLCYDDQYTPLSYNLLKVTISSGRFFEEGDLPEDANVVERTWRFSKPDGSPDPRYKKDNVQIPVVLYTLLEISTPSGVKANLMVSSRQAALRFATTFGAEDPRKTSREEEWTGRASDTASGQSTSRAREKDLGASYRAAEILQREANLSSARRTLGVAKGASMEQISAAYRKLARTHHPDKVANMEPNVRERSERRMKEINAAYALLKRQGGGPVSEETG
jgi:hypothetical protein